MLNSVVILEDDKDILANISEFLTRENFEVTETSSLTSFKVAIKQTPCALAIIDLGLPDGSGLDAVSYMRENTNAGVIVLTAQDGFNEKMKGYEAGADYYFTKPTSPSELVAAARSILARLNSRQNAEDSNSWLLVSSEWILKSPDDHEIPLTNKEMLFLTELAKSPDNSSSKDSLLRLLSYEAKGLHGQKALDVMITRLRKKIKGTIGEDAPIKTIHQVGLKFTKPLNFE